MNASHFFLTVLLFVGPVLAADEKAAQKAAVEGIDFEKARGLLQRQNRGEKLSAEEAAYLERAKAARKAGQKPGPDPRMIAGKDKIGQKPLSEMTASDRYQGEDGGLYGGGSNTPPEAHRKSAEAALARIRPRNGAGEPADDGRIALVSLSMSNATQEFSTFKPLADLDPRKSPRVTIVDCAQGGQAMAEWADPKSRTWDETDRRLAAAAISPKQVQAAWIKLANKGPQGSLEEHGRKLEKDTLAVIQNAKARFPNLQVAYLSSRIYGGYATGPLNPEPFAFESAFAVRWLIQRQIKGDEPLSFSGEPAKAPVLLWGPYLWADGVTPRSADKLVYTRDDLAGDGTHPSASGRQKVARMLLEFFAEDPLAKPWFAK